MELSFQPMTEQHARLLLTWQYAEPYTIYSMDSADPEDDIDFFTDPANAYFAVLDAHGALIAFRCFGADAQVPGGDYSADALDTGGGLRPDLTGRGLGLTLLNAGLAFGQRLYAPAAFRVTVAAFNQRALTVVTRAGFQRVQQFRHASDGREFVVLVRAHLPFSRASARESGSGDDGAGPGVSTPGR